LATVSFISTVCGSKPREVASKRSRCSLPKELSTTRCPSLDQINQFSSPGADVKRVRSPDFAS
jgi:hypothetical protein